MKNSLFVVALGTSAGGLKALQRFFSLVPAQPDVSFIVVQHLLRNYPSRLSDLITKCTKLKVKRVEGEEMLEPNVIYVIPEAKKLEIENYTLKLIERPLEEKINKSVDHFFVSLANDVKDKAIGIILTGTGSDGVEGAKAIENNGGIILVQQPKTAEFKDMPNNIVLKNHPDYILPIEKMPDFIIEFTRQESTKTDYHSLTKAFLDK